MWFGMGVVATHPKFVSRRNPISGKIFPRATCVFFVKYRNRVMKVFLNFTGYLAVKLDRLDIKRGDQLFIMGAIKNFPSPREKASGSKMMSLMEIQAHRWHMLYPAPDKWITKEEITRLQNVANEDTDMFKEIAESAGLGEDDLYEYNMPDGADTDFHDKHHNPDQNLDRDLHSDWGDEEC